MQTILLGFRGRMLAALMDGRARTAVELALEAGVTQSTASSHLARLTAAGLVLPAKQGRHRYFRIAGQEVAAALEALTSLGVRHPPERSRPGPREQDLRHARVCYDHLAGEAGVRLLERLRQRNFISGSEEDVALTRAGETWCGRVGIGLDALHARRRPLCRSCLDWTERRMHLAGALGAALLDRLFALRYARRERGRRVITLSVPGERFIERLELAR
ncbi:MAG: ArsR/SmtB family transcription factor [Gemmatimonadales bacterium]